MTVYEVSAADHDQYEHVVCREMLAWTGERVGGNSGVFASNCCDRLAPQGGPEVLKTHFNPRIGPDVGSELDPNQY